MINLNFLLERPGFQQNGFFRRHAPRYLSVRRKYLGGRNYWRFFLGPVVLDILLRKRESGD
jgi:hypothetical protein